MDPAEVRRRNLIAPDDFPHETVVGATYDSGDYAMVLDRVLAAADYDALRAEQAARRADGGRLQLGLGLSVYVELTGFGSETSECTVADDGHVTVTTGTSPHGQGHETAWAQLVSATLGVPMEDVTVVHSDTRKVAKGQGTMGSRSLQVGGSAVLGASREVLAKGRELAAHLLEAAADDIEVFPGEGLGVAGAPGTVLAWADLARAAADPGRLPEGMEPGLAGTSRFKTPDATYPFGAHLSVAEVDVETGLAKIVRHVSVDDSGTIANPLLAEGQVHGGIAQGIAQALYEEIAHDEDGNCVTGSLASYAIPSAGDLPTFETERTADAVAAEPARGEGDRRVGHDRLDPRGAERGDRRGAPSRRHPHRHARHAAAGVARDRGGPGRLAGSGDPHGPPHPHRHPAPAPARRVRRDPRRRRPRRGHGRRHRVQLGPLLPAPGRPRGQALRVLDDARRLGGADLARRDRRARGLPRLPQPRARGRHGAHGRPHQRRPAHPRLRRRLVRARLRRVRLRVRHRGHAHRRDGRGAWTHPRPLRAAQPGAHAAHPVLIGGGGERKTLRQVARHADVWHGFGDADTIRHKCEVLDGWCEREGRDPAEIERSCGVSRSRPEEVGDALRAVGVTTFQLSAGGPDYELSGLQPWLQYRDAVNGAS